MNWRGTPKSVTLGRPPMDEMLDTPPQETPLPAELPELPEPAGPGIDKRRLEGQLEALKRREFELRRALAVADHPELADAIRLLDGRAYALARVEAKLAQGLSKSEERRKETLDKKLGVLRAKAAELDAQIAELSAEHANLVHTRFAALESERRAALNDLVACLGEHVALLASAGLDAADLVPEIGQRMAEIRAAAQELVDAPRAGHPPVAPLDGSD
jgi:chromosome segregation ATPase